MNRDLIERKFEAMGARVRFQDLAAMNRSRFLRDLNENIVVDVLREGGEVVFVHPRYARRGLTEAARERLFQRKPQAARAGSRQIMRRNPQLFVRGSVRHPDHKTIRLNGWHRVALNLEERGRSVAFLD